MMVEPEADESHDGFIERCIESMPEAVPDEQAEEICEQQWVGRAMKTKQQDRKKQVADIITRWKKKFGDNPSVVISRVIDDPNLAPAVEPGESKDDYVERCIEELTADEGEGTSEADLRDLCEDAFDLFGPEGFGEDSHKPSRIKRDRKKQVADIIARWKKKFGKDPSAAILRAAADAPEPEEDETHDDFLNRCIDDLIGDGDMGEYEAEGICEDAWDASGAKDPEEDISSHKPAQMKHKTHAETVQGMEFVLSDETPDRMGDIITSTGWEFEQFNKNPIALFNHNANFPIGRWKDLRIDGTALKGHLIMAPKGTSDRIDELRKLIDVGILKAVSVGFRDIESEPINKKDPWSGIKFIKQELVETSLVSVPANPNALAVAKSLNISATTIDLVFAKHGKRDRIKRRSGPTGKYAQTSRKNGRGAMTPLAERIATVQALLTESKDKLKEHWEKADNTNVSDADIQLSADLNATIAQLDKQLSALIESERLLGKTVSNGGGTAQVNKSRALAVFTPQPEKTNGVSAPAIVSGKKELPLIDYLVRAGTVAHFAKQWNKSPDEVRLKIYGEDEATKASCELVLRAASAPAITTVTGWAAELVQQTYAALMPLLMPQAILTRLSTRGLALSFGTAGRIIIPTRSRTPTLAGSFVGEGLAIPVRQGAFTTQTLVPKKMAVISTWTREMGDHSVPAIEGLIREAIQQDTSVAVDTVLIDANPATAIRPAGLLNGVAATTATAGGGLAALIGDIKALTQALVTSTYGNLRSPVFMMNPGDVLSASLASAVNTGIFPFRDEVRAGTLNTIPIIDSSTVPSKTMILVDAADFVVVGGEAPRMEMSDQATLHMEDTSPAELVASPSTVAAPQRSLFQTDSLALRMVLPLNWTQRRAGTVAWAQNVTWS
jgi:HK97 family phage prohead protease/HK97 family phage major capsid protein